MSPLVPGLVGIREDRTPDSLKKVESGWRHVLRWHYSFGLSEICDNSNLNNLQYPILFFSHYPVDRKAWQENRHVGLDTLMRNLDPQENCVLL